MPDKRFVNPALLFVWTLVLIQPSRPFIFRRPTSTPKRFSDVKNLFYSSGLEEYLGSPEFNSTLPGDDVLLDAYNNWRMEYNKGEFMQDRFENFIVNYKTLMTANTASSRQSHRGQSLDFQSYMSLNEYGDCSIEEYKNIVTSIGESGGQPNNISPTAPSGSQQNFGPPASLGGQRNVSPVTPSRGHQSFCQKKTSSVQHDQQFTEAYGVNVNSLEWDIYTGESAIEKEIHEQEAKHCEIRLVYEAWCAEKGKPFNESRFPIFAEHYLKAEDYCAKNKKPLKFNEFADLTTEEYNALSLKSQQQTMPSTELPASTQPSQDKSVGSVRRSSAQPPLDANLSTMSYLDSISKGKVTNTYFGEKKEIKEEDLVALFSKLNEAKEEEEEARIQARRAEISALEAGEVARIKEEEQARLTAAEDARQQTPEDSRLVAWEQARRQAEIEAKQRVARNSQDDSIEPQEKIKGVAFRPMSGSYMGAVAKTWESRSEYLAKLEASTKYLESLQDVPVSELPNLYSELDAITGSLPLGSNDAGSSQTLPGIEMVENNWEEDELESEDNEMQETDIEIRKKNIDMAQMRDSYSAFARRQRDEMAAQRAREEAEEWMQIQKQLEEQADLARERRKREEKALLKAQQRAKELEAGNLDRERRLKELEVFENQRKSTEDEVIEKGKELQENTERVRREADKLRGEIQDRRKSNGPPILSFVGSSTGGVERQEKPKALQRSQPIRQETRAKVQQKRSKRPNQMEDSRDQNKRFREPMNFFGWFQNGSAKKSNASILISMWSQNEDGSISGIVEKSSQFVEGVRITTSPITGSAFEGAIVDTASGNRYQLGVQEIPPYQATKTPDLFRTAMDFFEGLQKVQEVALLFDWQANEDGTITGFVTKKRGFNDGAKITTSPVIDEIAPGKVVRTYGGSYYRLM